jgi:hypothetical protein
VSAIPRFPVTVGALAEFSAGQGVNRSDAGEVANFADNGFTHLDLSATARWRRGR